MLRTARTTFAIAIASAVLIPVAALGHVRHYPGVHYCLPINATGWQARDITAVHISCKTGRGLARTFLNSAKCDGGDCRIGSFACSSKSFPNRDGVTYMKVFCWGTSVHQLKFKAVQP